MSHNPEQTKNTPEVPADFMSKAPQFQRTYEWEKHCKRVENKNAREQRQLDFYNTKLHGFISEYYMKYTNSVEENMRMATRLDKSWRQLIHRGGLIPNSNVSFDSFMLLLKRNTLILQLRELEPDIEIEYISNFSDEAIQDLCANKSLRENFKKEWFIQKGQNQK